MANNNNNKTTGVGQRTCRRWWIGSRSTPPFYTAACIAAASASLPAGTDRWSLDDIIGPYPLAGSVDLQPGSMKKPDISLLSCDRPYRHRRVSHRFSTHDRKLISNISVTGSPSLCLSARRSVTVNFIRRETWQMSKMIKSRRTTRLSLSRIK